MDDWKFYSYGRAEYKPFKEKMEEETDILFVPPVIPGVSFRSVKYCFSQ